MSDPCRWTASDQPRVTVGEHYDTCEDTDCRGCWPCLEPHCDVCRRAHCDPSNPLTCPSCVGDTRTDLDLIVDMHARLRGEAMVRSMAGDREGTVLGGDAMVMLAMTWREQTGLAADGDHSHESPADPIPPLLTLATWEDCWREHLEHDAAGTASIVDAAAYLDKQLTHMAQNPALPFSDFARDVRQARGRLEDVLRDGVRDETGAPCPKCDRPLVKKYGRNEHWDRWVCPSRACGEWYLDGEYRRWVTSDYRANADALTAPDMEAQYEVAGGTLRGWATLRAGETQPRVRKRGKDGSGRQLYDVGDVLAMQRRKESA